MGNSKADEDGASPTASTSQSNPIPGPDLTRPNEDLLQGSDTAIARTADGKMDGQRRRTNSLMKPLDSSAKRGISERRNSLGLEGHEDSKLRTSKDGEDDDMSSSEDFELDELSDDGLQDDEETGLTGKDRGKRRRRKESNTLLDHRIAGAEIVTAEEKKEADGHVLKNMLINGTLIGLWYIFSLSISLVGLTNCQSNAPANSPSTTSGCSHPSISISTSPSSRPPGTWLSNSPSLRSSCSASPNSGLDTTP